LLGWQHIHYDSVLQMQKSGLHWCNFRWRLLGHNEWESAPTCILIIREMWADFYVVVSHLRARKLCKRMDEAPHKFIPHITVQYLGGIQGYPK